MRSERMRRLAEPVTLTTCSPERRALNPRAIRKAETRKARLQRMAMKRALDRDDSMTNSLGTSCSQAESRCENGRNYARCAILCAAVLTQMCPQRHAASRGYLLM